MVDDNKNGVDGDVRKGEIRFHKAIQEKLTGTVIFFIPDSQDEKEKKEMLENQIIGHLIRYSNMLGSYQKAIDEVQGYLKALIRHFPEEEILVKTVADSAGTKFLKVVDEAKVRSMRERIQRGEMFLGVKNISGGKHG